MANSIFYKSIKYKDKNMFKNIEKGDLHVHGILGASREKFNLEFNTNLPKFESANSIYDLKKYIANNIVQISSKRKEYIKLIDLTIDSAISEGVSIIALSVDYRSVFFQFNNDFNEFIKCLKFIKYNKKNINIKYDLGISRENFKKTDELIIKKLIDSKVFSGIDLYGNELSTPIKKFVNIYKYAKKRNLELKAHVGEFGSAKDIIIAIKKLNLETIQHGISIIHDEKAIKYALKHKIKFNVCPISNIKMGIVKNISDHPIRKMFDSKLFITINTDDKLIFENSIFDEYFILFSNNVFSIDELDIIRQNSLK